MDISGDKQVSPALIQHSSPQQAWELFGSGVGSGSAGEMTDIPKDITARPERSMGIFFPCARVEETKKSSRGEMDVHP
jgi:hypothetical protein